MKIIILLIAATFLAPIPQITEVYTKCYAVLIRKVTGYGDTQGAAYANARSKIPAGYRETDVSFYKVGYKWHCYLTCQK
jgi:hypothetical protein